MVPDKHTSLNNSSGNSDIQKSELNEDIIGRGLHWFIRNGNMIILGLLFLLVFFCWIIKYPDTVAADAKILSVNTPQPIVAKTNGNLAKLLVKNGQYVSKGQLLGQLKCIGNLTEILELENWVDSTVLIFRHPDFVVDNISAVPDINEPGELQSAYQDFQDNWKNYLQTLDNGYYQLKIRSIKKDLDYLHQLKVNNDTQILAQLKQIELNRKELNAYESLEKDKVIAPLELDRYKSQLIRNEQSLKQLSTQSINSQLNKDAKVKELQETFEQIRQTKQSGHSALMELKIKIAQWIEEFLVIAPSNGTVVFTPSLFESQSLASGQTIFYIEQLSTDFYGEINVGQDGFGKVRTGQKVILRPLGYPAQEYGYVSGVVQEISRLPNKEDNFQIRISIPPMSAGGNKKSIRLQHGLIANAEIITNERRLLERLMGQLYLIFN